MNRLFQENEGLLRRWARYYAAVCRSRGDVDFDDLYQSGCIGLMEAAKTHDEAKGSWPGWAGLCIRRAMREALGRGHRPQTVPLDTPVDGDDDTLLLDSLPDETIIPDDERMISIDVANIVRAAVDALPEDAAQAVRAVGLRRLSRADAAREMGVAEDELRRRHARGLRCLRSDERLRALAGLDQRTRFHAHKPVTAFFTSHSSVVEDIVEWRLERGRC